MVEQAEVGTSSIDLASGRDTSGSRPRVVRRNAAVLAAVAVAVRVVLALLFRGPSISNDTKTYVGMSRVLFDLRPSNYTGLRVPGYPFIIRILDYHLGAVWFFQAALGVGACLLLYAVIVQLTGRAGVALITGLVLTLSLDVLFFETEILTEATVLFVLTASIYAFVQLLIRPTHLRWALVLGVLTGLAALTRPETALLMLVWPAAWLMVRTRIAPSSRGRTVPVGLASMIVPVIIGVAGWSGANASLVGEFAPTTLSGYNLVDHLGPDVKDAPQRYAVVRNDYVRLRDKSIASGLGDEDVSVRNTAQLERVSGKSFVGLSKEFTSMSLAVIEKHPLAYAKITADLWPQSWKPQIYWQPQLFRSTTVARVANDLWNVERHVRIFFNVLFFVLCLSVFSRTFRTYPGVASRVALSLMAVVVIMSIPQAILANGENARYMFPYFPMMLIAVAVSLDVWHRIRRERRLDSGRKGKEVANVSR